MQTRKLGRCAGLTLALCAAFLVGAVPGGVADADAACPASAMSALSTSKMIAAVRPAAAPGKRRIYSMNLDGTGKALINTTFPSGEAVRDTWRPRISPDRKSMLFYTGEPDYPDQMQLWSASIDGSGSPEEIVPKPSGGGTWKSHNGAEYSPNGLFAVTAVTTATNATEQLYVIDLCSVGTPPAKKTSTLISTAQPLLDHRTPSFSHDGGGVFYSRCVSILQCRGTDLEIYRMSAFGDSMTDNRITTDLGTQYQDLSPIESPTGGTVAFTRLKSCKAQIYKVASGGGAASLVVDDADINLAPSWDRLGAKLYFARMPDGTQWRLASVPLTVAPTPPPTTATDVPLGTNCAMEFTNLTQNSGSAVASDPTGGLAMGRMVATVTRTDGPNTPGDHPKSEIYSMNLDGSAPTRLTFDGDTSKGSWWPQLSPNRQKILYYKNGVENYVGTSLWIMNWDGSGQTELIPPTGPDAVPGLPYTPPASGAWYIQGHATWSPNGNYIVMFAGNATNNGATKLWITTSSGQSLTQISTAAVNATQSRLDPSFSADGAWIIYTRCPDGNPDPCDATKFEVYKQSVFGDVIGGVSNDTRLTTDSLRDHDPFMSPNGTWIAFLRQVSCNRWGIFKIPSGGGAVTTIFDDGGINALPSWNRTSDTIFFHRLPVIGWERDLYSVNASAPFNKTALSTGSDHCNAEDPSATAVSG